MDKLTFVVVGQYHHNPQNASEMMTELVAYLRELGEINVFDMPHTEFGDSAERDDFLYVHHYACPNGELANASMRTKEMVRDIVMLGARECYIDFDVADTYKPVVSAIEVALRKYGVKSYSLNKKRTFRLVRNLCWKIRFMQYASDRQKDEEYELSQIEGYSGHGSMDGLRLSKIYEKQRRVRSQLLQLIKQH